MTFPETAGRDMLALVDWQLGFGMRYPGSPGHDALARALEERVRASGVECVVQSFGVTLGGVERRCSNVVARLGDPGLASGPVLFGTHWDTRLIADREPEASRRALPIPGANDGGSGTAVLLYLLEGLRESWRGREIQIAFLDAEDVGDIDGNIFSTGAAHLAAHPLGRRPAEVIALDMVGGREMVLDRDGHAARHPPSLELTLELFRIGSSLELGPFTRTKPRQWKYIISDHYPFLRLGIPSAILIDIDYPPWHTHADLPLAMDGDSLAAVLQVVATYLDRYMV